MKRVVLFESGYVNLSQLNVHFLRVSEDEWTCDMTESELKRFCEINNIAVNHAGLIVASNTHDGGDPFGYVHEICDPYIKKSSVPKKNIYEE